MEVEPPWDENSSLVKEQKKEFPKRYMDAPLQVMVNNKGHQITDRKVVEERTVISKQPPRPPNEPQILLLDDRMLQNFPTPHKYI